MRAPSGDAFSGGRVGEEEYIGSLKGTNGMVVVGKEKSENQR